MAPGRSTINLLLLAPHPASFLSHSASSRPLTFSSSLHSSLSQTLFRRQSHSNTAGSSPSLIGNTTSRLFARHFRLNPAISRSPYSTVVVHNRGQARGRRFISFLVISTVFFCVGIYGGATYAPPIPFPLIMGSMPTDAETLGLFEGADDYSREVDEHIRNSPLAKSLRANPDFIESRPHLKIPAEVRQHNLTGGTLAGPGMIVVPPYNFNEKEGKSMVQIFYVGSDCSGHPGIVHGGFLATMLDEGLARCAFPAMPNKVGVTANLQLNYLKPTMAGQFLVLKATTTKVEGRKAWVEGWIESLEVPEGEEPQKLVVATALFIEPKYSKALKAIYGVSP